MNYTKFAEGMNEDEGTSTVKEPGPKTPKEMNEDPKSKTNPEVVKDMAANQEITDHSDAIHKMEMSPDQAKAIWSSVTKGAVHKHEACVNAMKSKVKDAHAFCQYIGKKSGYTPER